MADNMQSRKASHITLLAINAAFLLFLVIYRMGPSIVDLDMYHAMALIREAIQSGSIPDKDLFSFSETVHPVVHHEWGAGLIAYLIAQHVGSGGIVVLRYFLFAALLLLIALGLRRNKVAYPVILLLAPMPIYLLCQGTSAVRAQMYSFVFTAALLNFFDLDRRNRRWWIPLWLALFTAWVNLHGGFLVGLGLMALYGVERCLRKEPYIHVGLTLAAMAALISFNPFGWDYYPYLYRAITMPRPHIAEWQSLLQEEDWANVAFIAFSLALAGYFVFKAGLRKSFGCGLLLVTAILAVRSNRIGFFYVILWAWFFPVWIQSTFLDEAIQRLYAKRALFLDSIYLLSAAILSSLVIQAVPPALQVPDARRPEWGRHLYYPVKAVEYLKSSGFRGNILVPFDWGSYVSWHLHPRAKVSIDSRYEAAYPPHVELEHYDIFMGRENWKELLGKYPADLILTSVKLPLSGLMAGLAEWRKVYADCQWEIYASAGNDLPSRREECGGGSGKFP